MKGILNLAMVMLVLFSCEHDTDREYLQADSTQFFKTSTGLSFRFSDFSFYDSSSHIYYLKDSHPEMEDWDAGTFAFVDEPDTLLSGNLWPVYFSSVPPGAFIGVPHIFYPDYVLCIENWNSEKSDPRNNPRLIQVLEDKGMLRRGLSVKLEQIYLLDGAVVCSVRVENMDSEDLLILDPEKMGPTLFNFYTTGLYLYESITHQFITPDNPSQAPVPADSWNAGWFTRLQPSESKTFLFQYGLGSNPPAGTYEARFSFPGLSHQVSREQLYQNNARIWLGEVRCSATIDFR